MNLPTVPRFVGEGSQTGASIVMWEKAYQGRLQALFSAHECRGRN
jgi:hypothetical protein